MRYESEILYDLMKRDGLLNPSQNNLPYESELKEEYIDGIKGAYPKLTDYQAEWLNYAYNEQPIGEFPYVTLTDVTNATIENVVPYAYKSAILRGDTKFINEYGVVQADKTIFHSCYFEQGTIGGGMGATATKEDSASRIRTIKPLSLENGSYSITVRSDYEVYIKIINSTNNIGIRQGGFNSSINFDITVSSKEKVYMVFRKSNNSDITCDEVEEIVSSSNIPELTSLSLVSVQMPVLTTTGKNLFDSSFTLTKGKELNSDGTLITGCWAVVDFMPITFSGDCVFSSVAAWLKIAFYTEDKTLISLKSAGNNNKLTFSVPENAKYFRVSSGGCGISIASDLHYQIEQGAVTTTYEPYKSNLLTVNEDVELCGIGEVKDELNLLTGEISNNFNKITIDGTENWYKSSNETELTVRYRCENIGVSILKENMCICDSYNVGGNVVGDDLVVSFGGRVLTYRVLKSKFPTLEDFKKWLNDNPHTFIYQTEKSIKTVDLTITNQNGETLSKISPIEGTMNLITSSDTIPPLFNGEIPVEAIKQNLASFTDLEGVEHDG